MENRLTACCFLKRRMKKVFLGLLAVVLLGMSYVLLANGARVSDFTKESFVSTARSVVDAKVITGQAFTSAPAAEEDFAKESFRFAARLVVDDEVVHVQAEKLPLFRDLYTQEEWPEIEHNQSDAVINLVPRTVHYMWCGKKQFRFQHYLAILSAIRLLQPINVVFHYTHLPVIDGRRYNVWLEELKQSYANLELRQQRTNHPCGSSQMVNMALSFISRHGGIVLGENAILTRVPAVIMASTTSFWCANNVPGNASSVDAAMVAFASHGFDVAGRQAYVNTILTGRCAGRCGDVNEYDGVVGPPGRSPLPCVVVNGNVYPRDIWQRDKSSFARLARWLFYGKREVLKVHPTANGQSIPRVGHFTWINNYGATRSQSFQFLHFLAVLSALHVAGLRHVYVHGDLEPRGHWWELLKGENVTFLPLDFPRSVFQQSVNFLSHKSDVVRAHVLHKYGGVYQDRDVVWASRLPDWLFRYPTVLSPDWPWYGEWPEVFNTGVFMSQPHAPWLRHFLFTMRQFVDIHHTFNAVMMAYRAYEWHPDTLYVDRHLQAQAAKQKKCSPADFSLRRGMSRRLLFEDRSVLEAFLQGRQMGSKGAVKLTVICFKEICHPAWHDDYQREINDKRKPRDFDWREGRAYHFTVPKVPPSLASPGALASGKDFLAEMGRQVLIKAGRGSMLKN